MKLGRIPEERLSSLSNDEKTRIVFGGERKTGGPGVAALLLGCGTPPEMAERAAAAAGLFEEGLVPYVVPTGGVVHPTELGDLSEAGYMARKLRESGVPDAAVVLEDQATTTIANMVFGMAVIEREFHPRGPFSVYVVTSDAHMRRSLALADAYLPRTARILSRPAGNAGGGAQEWFRSEFWTEKVNWEIRWLRKYIGDGILPDIEF